MNCIDFTLNVHQDPSMKKLVVSLDPETPLPQFYVIMDEEGRVLQQGLIVEKDQDIQTRNLSAGIYALELANGSSATLTIRD